MGIIDPDGEREAPDPSSPRNNKRNVNQAQLRLLIDLGHASEVHLASEVELHPGVIVLRSHGLSRDEQWDWLEPVVDSLIANETSLVNKAVEVTGIGLPARRLHDRPALAPRARRSASS